MASRATYLMLLLLRADGTGIAGDVLPWPAREVAQLIQR